MTDLVDRHGKPLVLNKKATPPKLGESFGDWAGSGTQFQTLPGGGVVQFDLNRLTLDDFRQMRDHYQVNASLAVLSFMQHQSDYHVVCENKKIAEFCEEQIKNNWTGLNRAMSTANWAGYSPNALEWENDSQQGKIVLSKVKDLIPEECRVNWKLIEGWAPPGRTPPKFKSYDGIIQDGHPGWPIPVENSLWYPLLMENGDYYGRKLLRPAFTSWFFSILMHLFANRYYERFGEPTPVGRAPYDEDIQVGTNDTRRGADFMLDILQKLRSRGAVVLPNDRSQDTMSGRMSFDYDIEYLESQMRGVDFERYMTRLDEEISIGLFTPILLLRTADVGSYSLGVGHMQMYLWMLNAMNDDRAFYINKYILSKMTDYNFGVNAPRPKIVFRKMGNTNAELLRELLIALVNKDLVKVDVQELGQMAGMTLGEIKQTVAPDPAPEDPAAGDGNDGAGSGSTSGSSGVPSGSAGVATEIKRRVRGQVEAAFRDERFGNKATNINMGYMRKMERAFANEGFAFPAKTAEALYDKMDILVDDVMSAGSDIFSNANEFMGWFEAVLDGNLKELHSHA